MNIKITARRALTIFLLALWTFAVYQPASAADQVLDILSGPVVARPDKANGDRASAVVVLRNNGPDIAQLVFRAVKEDGQDIAIEVNTETKISGYSVRQFEIEFPDPVTEKVAGYLIVEAKDVTPAVEALTLEPVTPAMPQIIPGMDKLNTSLIILSSFLVGFVFVIVVSLGIISWKYLTKIKDAKFIQRRMSGLKWDFTQNWASTLVAVGGILTTIVGSKVMPENPVVLSTQGFQLLNILFPILIVVAPFLLSTLNALGTDPKDDSQGTLILDEEKKTPLLIVPFVIGSAVVTWAVIGELTTLAVLFGELSSAKYISNGIALSAQALLVLLCLLALYYAIKKMLQTSLSAKTLEELKKQATGTPRPTKGSGEMERTGKKPESPVYLP